MRLLDRRDLVSAIGHPFRWPHVPRPKAGRPAFRRGLGRSTQEDLTVTLVAADDLRGFTR